MTQLYWITDESCIDPYKDGYIGVSENALNRFKAHKKNNRVPKNSNIQILYEGTREQCFEKEYEYRPLKKIGWNNAAGGKHGYRIGFEHSIETKEKLKLSWTDERKEIASKFKTEENKKMKGQKRPAQSKSISGEKNPIYGTIRPDNVKEAVRLAHKDKSPKNKMEYYCIICKQRVSESILKKYHGIGKTNCLKE